MSSAALLEAIDDVVRELAPLAIATLADALVASDGETVLVRQQRVLAALPTPTYRRVITPLLAVWQREDPTLSGPSLALALRAAGRAAARERAAQTVEIVWSGPAGVQPTRRTAQVLEKLIDSAQRDLLIVSFAAYDVPAIGAALRRAMERGIAMRLVIESPEASAGRVTFDGLTALGADVARHAQIYRWPLAKRQRDDAGRHGTLHAKCAVADGETLLISSANLTRYALTLNIELGVQIRGRGAAGQVVGHITELIARGVLVQVA